MSDLVIEVETEKASMDELRGALDAAFQKHFQGGMLRRSWAGDVLELSGPGASGAITLDAGTLRGEAELKPPASLMRATIEQKVGAALRDAVAAVASG